MDEKLSTLAEHLSASLSGAVTGTEIRHGELCCKVERDALIRVLMFLRDDPKCRFTVLCDVCGVDFLSPWEGMDKVLPGDEKASGDNRGAGAGPTGATP